MISTHKFRLLTVRNIHLNVNSLLPKIDKLCDIAKLSNAAIIGKTQSKLGNDSETKRVEV